MGTVVVVTFEAASYDASHMAFPVKGSCRRGDELKVARPLVKILNPVYYIHQKIVLEGLGGGACGMRGLYDFYMTFCCY